jgi:hypothetical protein
MQRVFCRVGILTVDTKEVCAKVSFCCECQNGLVLQVGQSAQSRISLVCLLLRPVKVKLSRYTPWWRLGREEVLLLPILNLGTRWG